MGVIFSPENVRDGAIPKPGAHDLAGQFILRALHEGINEKDPSFLYGTDAYRPFLEHSIDGAMIYGSTALGYATIRSDVDVFVAFNDYAPENALPHINDVISHAEAKYDVPVETNVLGRNAMGSPLRHNIDPYFAEHLNTIQENEEWSWGWPVQGLRTRELSKPIVQKLALRYISTKARQYVRAFNAYRGQPDLAAMQRALELPSAIGRKAIPAFSVGDGMGIDAGNKRNLAEATFQQFTALTAERMGLFADPAGPEEFEKLYQLDGEYDALLAATLGGNTSISEYEEWIKNHYQAALMRAFKVSSAWCRLILDRMVTFDRRSHADISKDTPLEQFADLQASVQPKPDDIDYDDFGY